jgi:translation initiation factor IF-2
MAEKTYRISKVASELNVSFQTLIERLVQKGFEVESKPTAKITDEMYTFLHTEFKSDKAAKEESKTLGAKLKTQKTEEKPIVKKVIEKVEQPEVKKPATEEKEEDDQILIKSNQLNDISEEPVKQPEEVEVKQPEEDKIAEIIEPEDAKHTLKGMKVIGKIDLSEFEKKSGSGKKKEEPKLEKPVSEKVTIETKDTEPEIIKEKPKDIFETPKEKTKILEPAEEEIIKVKPQFEKLSGLTIKGKIELKPEESRGGRNQNTKGPLPEDLKKKKKRVRKVVEKVKIDEEIKDKRIKKKETGAPKTQITDKEIQEKLKATLSRIGGSGRGKNIKSKFKKQRREDNQFERLQEQEQLDREQKILKVTEFVSANELANLMSVNVNDVITTCFNLGLMVSINQRLDAETITIVADEFGFETEFVDAESQLAISEEEVDTEEELIPRPPIVTVMGHVDHGKTSLLDYIRKANVISGEAGGITQHIGAYEVKLADDKKITFLDTPGHEAFTAMRARGAKVTDVAVIIIAADDNVMPQTKEAISHAQAAGVPMIFAINKIDKDGAKPDRIREELSQMNLLVEEWGGKYQCQEISAKNGINIDKLLEKILLEAELLELKANPKRRAKGTVIEAKLDKGRGIVANLLVQTGTLRVGDHLVAGPYYGKVKALFNERNQKIDEAGPSTPVSILGFSGAPAAGDPFNSMINEQEAKEIANKRFQLQREQGIRSTKHITLDEIGRRLAVGNFKELNLVVKGDVDGSVEALSDSLLKLSTEEIQINVIHKGVGQITESDVLLASASDAIIIGFQVRPAPGAKKLAEHEQIDIRLYSIIYKAIEEIKSAMEGMLSPEVIEKIIGNVEVREVFKISKVGTIAGCMVVEGKITRNSQIRLIRDGVVIHTGKLDTLKRFKEDVKEVSKGFDCGIFIHKYNEIEVGDNIEAFVEEEVKRKLK